MKDIFKIANGLDTLLSGAGKAGHHPVMHERF